MTNRYVAATLIQLDRTLYALFSRHADRPKHDKDRDRYRGAALSVSFDTYLARIYGLSWIAAVAISAVTILFGFALSTTAISSMSTVVSAVIPGHTSLPSVPRVYIVVSAAVLTATFVKRATITIGGVYLRWRSDARRAAIERSLPGVVRYLRALADGSEDRRAMVQKVAEQDAYGETSEAFGRILETAALTGSLDTGIRNVARETPSRELLAPFLLKFREHASQGSDSLQGYLRMESRMLSHQQSRSRQRAGDYLELLAELFIVLLVLPALLVIIVTVMSVLAPGLSRTVSIPGSPTVRELLVYGSSGFVLVVGGCAAILVSELRPPSHGRVYERPTGTATLSTVATNPASAAFVFAFPAVVIGWILWALGEPMANVVLLGYASYGLPVGMVALKRERMDDAKDREIRDFIHAVAGHVSLGKPFSAAVETVAREVDFGALQDDVDDLAFRIGLTTGNAEMDTRKEALDRFVTRIGTPLARQTVGLVTGALDVGSDAETTFETLQTEVGSLYHQRQKLRSAMLVYVAVGWTTALLVIGIIVAVNTHVLDGFAQLSTVSRGSGSGIDPEAVDIERDAWRFYLVTQSTMLASGWFSGVAARGRYEALLHSSALVVICYVVFAGVGMI